MLRSAFVMMLGLLVFGGCQAIQSSRPGVSVYNQRYSDAMGHIFVSSEPNGFLQSAELVDLNENPWIITGIIAHVGDVDVFDLGAVEVGDRIFVELDTIGSPFGGNLALLDDAGVILLANDIFNVYLGRTSPFIDVVIRRAAGSVFVAVAPSSRRVVEDIGSYSLFAFKMYGQVVPAPRPDTFILMFDGAKGERVGSQAPFDLPPFHPKDIDPVYVDDQDEMIAQIVFNVRRDFVNTNITILSTSEGDSAGPGMSRVFFGGFNHTLVGLAEGIDEFNAARSQEAIVFTESFKFLMHLKPTSTEMGIAIANTTSHEIGHLLGMLHTGATIGIMSVRGQYVDMVIDAQWELAMVDVSVFPIGMQDGNRILRDLQD